MKTPLVLHIILNSHLDPVWLWNRAQGEDAAIATARTTCDLLDEYPEIHATRGEAWFYETVERFDPATFRRMRRHVADGRLHVVGGWYVQPDCNLASPSTYALHARVAGEWFRRRLGAKARTGYNVDSFGHAATLPDFYAAAGIENYLFIPRIVFPAHIAAGRRLVLRIVDGAAQRRTPRRIVKLSLDPEFPILRRLDGIPGGTLHRKLDGEEYPVFGFCRLEGAGDCSLTAVSSDVFAYDVQPDGLLRLTRSSSGF